MFHGACQAYQMDGECSSGSNKHYISEKNVPGAALNGRNPASLTIPELKRWLLCREASVKGKKIDLVAR